MGMCAIYQEVKQEDFKKLLESDNFFETIEELEEKDGTALCDIDKMWDALHFLLNGFSAIYGAPEDNLLSEFIIGSESFNDEAEEFARYIPTEKVIKIAKKLNEINFEDYLKDFDMNKFAENGIYPDIWSYDDEREEIMEELSEHFETLKEFYNKVAENKNIVVITIC
ncbi:YfbM family protein [Fusobacterium polymorphum]|uniref:YfbM family protein n=1 Tax=Fusobacterium nucleatum subsp. polymorphum TaxID=76857 RepID=UPI0030D2954E